METKCNKHPKYKGRKKPTNNCPDCLALYTIKHQSKTRILVKQPIAFKDKSKYNRKVKHKNGF